ncbi:IMP cyclohydrolase [Oribacterium sp. KHPX15]|uniref:IMP cyclohydrolase n=1 Tax=Oribacterium sp. KHPX15 TaxID=1855342 RepID=UPI000898CE0E|nr:IMP cyclohydrolase [Oribacterium sp. KHPX15]SEA24761.1 IMP cyclohydrolase [Oribacterium sp. KHPX15]
MATYDVANLGELLKNNEYPGRGIVIGKSEDGRSIAIAYFIMGRSTNSRNRVFTEDGDTVTIYPADSSKVEDPSLIIYSPIRKIGDNLIVTNGDQTDTIYDFMRDGNTFEEALETREFEPDGPNWTPRISGVVTLDDSESYKMSILKSQDADGTDCARYTFSYKLQNGLGHFIHTYKENGNPIPTFEGEPERVAIPNTAEELKQLIWNNLNEDNKISLYVRYIDVTGRSVENKLVNKFEKIN